MKSQHIALFALLAACSGESDSKEVVVQSDDGSATLTIPAGALPSGTSADEIRVVRDDTRIEDFAGRASLWSLSPDGLQLGAAATLRMQVPVSEGELFSIDHFSSNTVESLRAQLSAPSDELIVEVQHFSDVGVFVFPEAGGVNQTLRADWTPAATNIAVDESTTPVLRITPPTETTTQFRYTNQEGSAIEVSTTYGNASWQYEGEWRVTGDISPSIAVVDAQTIEAAYADVSREFRCLSAGEFEIALLANTAMGGTRTLRFPDSTTEELPAEALAFVRPETGGSCSESGLYECPEPMVGCPDPVADCAGVGAAELTGCMDYEIADFTDLRVSSCEGGIDLVVTMADPLVIVPEEAPNGYNGLLQLVFHLGGLADEDGLEISLLSEDGHPFALSVTGSTVTTGNTAFVDDEGRLLLHVSQETIDGYELPVQTMYFSSFMKLDAFGSAHRKDETQLSAYACSP